MRGALLQRAHGEAEAARLVRAALEMPGPSEDCVWPRRRGDARVGQVAALVRRRTSVGLDWIAARLRLRSAQNSSLVVRRTETRQDRPSRQIREKLDQIA